MQKPILFIFFTLFVFSELHSQWQHIRDHDQPFSYIKDIEKKGNQLFASNECGVFTLAPGATEWKRITNHHTPKMYRVGDSIFTSFYHGIGIIDLTNIPLKEYHVPSSDTIYNSPSFAFTDSLMFITSNMGIYTSKDHGDSLQPYISGLPIDTTYFQNVPYYSLYTHDVITTSDFVFCATEKGIYRSDFNLSGWEFKNSGLQNIEIRKLLFHRDTLYAKSRDSLYISTDTGNSWQPIFGDAVNIIDFTVYNGEILVSIYPTGFFRSSDGGLNWQQDHSFSGKGINMITVSGNTLFISVVEDGIYFWDGVNWDDINIERLLCNYTEGLKNSTNQILIVSHGKVWRLDSGDVWTNVTPIDSTTVNYSEIEKNGDTIFVVHNSSFTGPIIYYTADNGSNWTKVNTSNLPFQFYYDIKLKFLNGKLYLITDELLFSTDNLGQSWQDLNPPVGRYSIVDFTVHNGDQYLSTYRKNALLVWEAGSNFWRWETGMFEPGAYVADFTMADSALFVNAGTKTYRKFTNSNNWTLIDSEAWYISGSISHNNLLFASANRYVQYSPDLGDSWYKLDTIVPGWLHDLGVLNDTIYAATYNAGVWKHAVPNFFSIDEKTSLTGIIHIYPNPASRKITISSSEFRAGRFHISDLGGRICHSADFREGEAVTLPHLAEGIYQLIIETAKGKINKPLLIRH